MSVRVAVAGNEDDVLVPWNDSQPILAARWPEAKGGPGTIPVWGVNDARAQIAMPGRTIWIVDDDKDSIGWLAASRTRNGLDQIILAGRHAAQRPTTMRWLRQTMLEALAAMASSVPKETPVFAEYPAVGDTTVLTFLGEMTANNGVQPRVRTDGMIDWPGLTADLVLAGLMGVIA